ncbi:MAG: CHAT domain-containing protein [Anaerolineae bacterium]|nr:CHAT domain-containing protein [Anaerolineae bacterium]
MSKILIVDDQPDVRDTLSGLLEDEGYTVCTASNEGEALGYVTQESFDFALIDVRLHGEAEDDESGLSLAMAFRLLNPQIRVIMLTQYVKTAQIVRAIRYQGVVDFIEKTPDVGQQILTTIREASKESQSLCFQASGDRTHLSLLLANACPLILRSRGHYVHSSHTSKILNVDLAPYIRKTDRVRCEVPDRRFQIEEMGQGLWRDIFMDHPEVSRAFLEARVASQSLSLVFETSREFLGLPLEFMRLDHPSEYLVLEHPVSRFICDALPRREAISPKMLARLKKLRVLIIASNTRPSISGVDRETQNLYYFLQGQEYIPVDVTYIPTEQATCQRVRMELHDAKYDIVHYAGHGRYDTTSPEESSLYFWSREDKKGHVVPMKAAELKLLLARSEVSLVYLSCCDATEVGDSGDLLDDDFLGLADAVIQAGVPSTLGFRWPVSDVGAPRLTRVFYHSLLEQGSPEIALWKARCEVAALDRNDMTWLSPILVHQE